MAGALAPAEHRSARGALLALSAAAMLAAPASALAAAGAPALSG